MTARTGWIRRSSTIGALMALAASTVVGVDVGPAAAVEPATGTVSPVCTASGDVRTCDFPFTGSDESWVVPADIVSSNIAVEARGASGGKGHVGDGGLGAYVAGTLTVAPGDKIVMILGGAGGDARPVGSSGQASDYGLGGFPNGGGAGGNAPTSDGSARPFDSGGGGGSSIVGLLNAQGVVVPVAIAAGGGGGAGGTYFRFGGINGANADADGVDGATYTSPPPVTQAIGGRGGETGTDSVGGAGGATGYCQVPGQTVGSGNPGTTASGGAPMGAGGNGGSAYNQTFSTGGGGGGGLTGGGGGGAGGSCDPSAFDRSGSGGGGGGGRSIYDAALLSNGSIALSGDVGDGSLRISYKVADALDPDTTIGATPTNPTADTGAQFAFSGTDGSGATSSGIAGFECALDGAPFTACTSPTSFTGLAQGAHTFQVRALDVVGHRDATPAVYQWTVDTSGSLGSCVPAGASTACTYAYDSTVAYQTWVVPDGVTRADVTVDGAHGGSSGEATGGQGGRTLGRISVTPGEVLRLHLGSRGAAAPVFGCVGGVDGGINGGGGGGCVRGVLPSAGGGGATDVRRSPYLLDDRLLVGGGGGGAALSPGGDGGGLAGVAGSGSAGGGGGDQLTGGANTGPFCPARAGASGAGGSDGDCARLDEPFGGGGGGGYFGGGGGWNGSGGGGGSSFATATATAVTLIAGGSPTADGEVQITYGLAQDSQTITFDSLLDRTFGDAGFPVSATSSSGLPVAFTATGDCTMNGSTVSLSAAGSCTITASQAGDAAYDAADDVSRTFAIAPAIELQSPSAAQYSDELTLSATIGGATGTVAFKLDGVAFCSATVSGGGVASCHAPVGVPAGTYTARATLTPDRDDQASASSEASASVGVEDAGVSFTGSPFVSTGSATQTSATVGLTGQVVEIDDGTLGDITKAKVVFDIYKSTNLSGTPDWSVAGTVASSGVVTASKVVPSDSYLVVLRFSNQAPSFYGGPAADATVVTVYTPTTGVWANGGGWVVDPSTNNIPVAVSTAQPKGSFGFSVRYKSGTTPQGQFVYVFHGVDGYDYVVKSTSWAGGAAAFTKTAAGGTTAFTAKASVLVFNPATGTTVPGLGGGNFTFRVDAADNGASDTFALTVSTSRGSLYHRVGTISAPRAVMGGNITVHRR